ncbi:hypothetical protein MMC22_001738 [Lobaria immixta]|nr:hypothetical protein [Lobaria immixta]
MGRNQNADFFAAASPADMQWSDFYRHKPNRDLAKEATTEERRRLNFQLLQENPLGAATCLHSRWSLFFRHVLKVFDIDDHWFRYEWQGRGSGHIHGFYWTKDSTKDSTKANEQGQYLPTGESS